MSGNIAVIYCGCGDLVAVAEAFADQAAEIASDVRRLQLPSGESVPPESAHPHPQLRDLEWADGIGFGTPTDDGEPAPELMRFIESTQSLWSSGALSDKATTVFTDEPERMAPESLLHPIYDTLYKWGAMIVGPREFEFESRGASRRAVGQSLSALRSQGQRCPVPSLSPGTRGRGPGRRSRSPVSVSAVTVASTGPHDPSSR